MNRQAVPSIFLSVSIVCFFAVALYQRDAAPRRSPEPDTTTRAVSPRIESGDRVGATAQGRLGVAKPAESPRDGIAAANPARADQKAGALAATTADEPTGRARPAPSRLPADSGEAPPVRTVSNRFARASSSQPSSPSVPADRARPSGWRLVPAGADAPPFTGRSGSR
jgi:hypothetical protein